MIEVSQVISVRKYKAGYEVRREIWRHGTESTEMRAAYTPSGDYIGDTKTAWRLVVRRGIAPQSRTPGHACSIGFCEREQQWYGWSHRAIFGFGIGAIVEKGQCGAEYLPIGFEAKTLEDAKRIAEAFAESVG